MGWLELFTPRHVWQWVAAVLAVAISLLLTSFLVIGDDDLGRLRKGGTDTSLAILQVVSRDDSGRPTRVRIAWTPGARGADRDGNLVLEQAEGSVEGSMVRVRTNGDIVWTQTKYHSESALKNALVSLLGPLLLGFVPVFLANLRYRLKPAADFTWAKPTTPA